jgi:putative NADH-flavin reductase
VKILVFGANGPTGREVVAQARGLGDEVTEFVRAVDGDATDPAAVGQAVPGHDAVVSALGRRRSFSSAHLMERAMRAIVPAMQRAGVRRLVVVSAFGVGETWRDAPLVLRLMHRTVLRDIFADKKVAQDYVQATPLDWTFVYPVALTDGPRTGRYRVGERLELRGIPTISRADVADFIARELHAPQYVRRTAIVSS